VLARLFPGRLADPGQPPDELAARIAAGNP
jgi:hypothetical protein